MTRIIHFTKYRFLMITISVVLIVSGIVGTIVRGGFNLGIDFQAGLSQRIQIARPGFSITYTGTDTVSLDISGGVLRIEVRGEEGVETFPFSLEEYNTIGALSEGLARIDGLSVALQAEPSAPTSGFVTGMSLPATLEAKPTTIHLMENRATPVSIEQVRTALAPLGSTQIQMVGKQAAQEYLVRVKDETGSRKTELENEILKLMEGAFGAGNIIVKQSDYVGAKVSKDIASQTFYLTALALVLILVYIWFRFKLAYAVAAIIALIHDVSFMLGVIGTFQLEVSTGTIAAVLTIIGYSLNDTIVIFDRIRENVGLMRESDLVTVIDTSISQSLSRTLMTSLTTLIAVLALFVFGTGMIKEFSFNLIVGIVVGTYSSIFIASPIFLGWVNQSKKRKRIKDERMYGTQGQKKLEQKGDAAVPASTEEKKPDVIKQMEIPAAQRKLKGKRQQKKKH